jgi:FKBP-type peptidyl-prolyl cis-trans isomerase FkpA/FKBP-type peptidyl-prolyl cis-trans isomerase FklB
MKKLSILCAAFMALSLSTTSCDAKKAPKMDTKLDSVSYFIGVNIGENFKEMPGDKINLDLFLKGLKQALASDTSVLTINQYELQMFMQSYFSEAQQKDAEKAKAASEKFLEENKKKSGVVTTPSGLQYKVIKESTGEKPDSTSTVKVHYTGTLADGTEFDSSVKRGEPTTFQVDQVIKGWTEGLLMMSVGSKYMFYIPSELGYGERGAGGKIKGNSALVFEVELIEIVKPEAEAPAVETEPLQK